MWTFEVLFFFIFSNINKRLQTAISEYLTNVYNNDLSKQLVSSASFVLAREKIKHTAFIQANTFILDLYYQDSSNYKTYRGKRLVAVDGTILTIPLTEENQRKFGKNVLSENGKWLKAQVSFASDVLNNICLDAEIQGYCVSERKLAKLHIDKLSTNNLYIYDRGYYCKDLLGYLALSGNDFCFRLKNNANKEIENFIKNKKLTDQIITISTPLLDVTVRLTKVLLENNQQEYLLTSLLNKNEYTKNDLKELYNLRWVIEEQYKDMKHTLSIENFSGKKEEFIKQDFYANILLYNMSMILFKQEVEKQANKPNKKGKTKKYHYVSNKHSVFSEVKQYFYQIYLSNFNIFEIITKILKKLVKQAIPIRKGRKYPRGITLKAKKKISRCYLAAT